MATVRVRLLGPIDVVVDGVPRAVSGLRRKALLAALALRAGRMVGAAQLVDIVWGESAPTAVANGLQRQISHLRSVLGARSAVVSRPPGYLLDLPGDATDVQAAEHLIRDGMSAADPEDGVRQLQAAVALWRGSPLAELAELPWFDDPARQLEGLLLRARQALIERHLDLGRAAAVVPELEALARAHPLQEQIAGLLMRALYHSGRQAEALAAYQRLRHTLAEELGIDPGPALRDLEAAILRQDPGLRAAPARYDGDLPVATAPVPPVPAQLPLAVAGFTGREHELARLDKLLAEVASEAGTGGGRLPAPVGIFGVSGTAGVGKTALAIQWAHRVAARFPDGQLYVNLRGYDPEQPVPAADALAGFLRAFGVSGQDIPLDLDERAARYRTTLSGRRVLVVLDNAGSAEQVRPLLPGTAGCLAVVTSRDSLAGLVALDGAYRLDLDLLPVEDAITLLRRLVGGRVDADPAAAAELAAQCARLPLALRIAAELAAAQPDTSLAGLARELADQQQRLDLLDAAGEVRTAVRSVFSWSYHQLPVDAAGAFRVLGLHPGATVDGYAVAALCDATPGHAGRLCAVLSRAHLIQPTGPGRYGIHDLLRAYAARLARAEDGEAGCRAALTRLFDWYLATSGAAMDLLHPAERHKRPRVEPAGSPPPWSGPEQARAWLDAERSNLVAVCAYAAAHGWGRHTVNLAQTLFRYLDIAGHHTDALAIHTEAHRAARDSGDRAGEARALNNLAAVFWWRAQYAQAAEYYREAVDIFRASGDPSGEADALTNLGVVCRSLGDLPRAVEYHRRALVLYRQTGNQIGEAHAVTSLGVVSMMLGELPVAVEHHEQALALSRSSGKTDAEADALNNLGRAFLRLGQPARAARYHEQALALYRQHGYRGGEANTLDCLGTAYRHQHDLTRAAEYHRLALALHRRSGTRLGEAAALNGLGETLRAAGDVAGARRHHTDALALATEVTDPYEQARAHDGLATIHHLSGDPTGARTHWEHALRIHTGLGTVDADSIRDRLRALTCP